VIQSPRFLSLKSVAERATLSHPTIERLAAEDAFPPPFS